eukprot:TRINITY_DN8300_c0_g1_i1.p1 TRINITY_DN8300_c0_g1~~TRINITY_DN8300_c0_g1_i1.p1  ORF type:complete len:293 (+),score=75.16 TRINITY_DN8300_c0_g1_i1:45-923(+)
MVLALRTLSLWTRVSSSQVKVTPSFARFFKTNTFSAADSETLKLIKELRALTSAPINECKKALQASNNDIKKAQEILKASGLAAASKRSSRKAEEGLTGMIISPDHHLACMLRMNCETDFVARNEEFQAMVSRVTNTLYSLAPQISQASSPLVQSSQSFGDFSKLYEISPEELLKAKLMNGEGNVQDVMSSTVLKLGENLQLRRAVILAQKDARGTLFGYMHNRYSPAIGSSGLVLALESDKDIPLSSCDTVRALGKRLSIQIVGMGARYSTRDQVQPQDIEDLKQQGITVR